MVAGEVNSVKIISFEVSNTANVLNKYKPLERIAIQKTHKLRNVKV